MRDTGLYRQILGLEKPWSVSRVDQNIAAQQVDVFVEHEPSVRWPCPECQVELACRDHAEERVWRHLDTCQFKTMLHARVPRVECKENGVLQVKVPWAEARGRFTLLMERFIIDVLQQCARLTAAQRILRISWDEAWGFMERAVARGRARKKAQVIMHYMVEAVDMVRKREHRSLKARGDETLKGTKYLWLYNQENVPQRRRSALETLKTLCLKVGRARAIKESLRSLRADRREGWARRFFQRWSGWAAHSRLAPVCKVAHTFRNHLDNILTYRRHAITNGVAEGLNSKIMTIERRACGYRNKEHFKTAIYFFFCGGLDLYPR